MAHEHQNQPIVENQSALAEAVLALTRGIVKEMNTRQSIRVTLDSRLDTDLGLGSLARMELLTRVERQLGVGISEQAFMTAETLRDVMRAIHRHAPSRIMTSGAPSTPDTPVSSEQISEKAKTLQAILTWHVEKHPERPHIYLYEETNSPITLSYADLYRGALSVAGGLQNSAFQPGNRAAIMLPTGREYLYSFFGILLAGGIPVPIYPPTRLSQLEDHLKRHIGILDNAGCQLLITIPEAKPFAQLLRSRTTSLRHITEVPELSTADLKPTLLPTRAEDIAFLQYTSGSTGSPKGVVLTHHNLLANIRAMGTTIQADSRDTFVSWLPLYHDMGLIGAWLGSLYYAFPLVLMSPLHFLARPERWLWAIHRHGGTLSAAPNFAYELCLNRIAESALEGLDLSSWRLAFNGAEPVSPQTLRSFCDRFSPYGFNKEVLAPVYGLAENAVGLTFPPLGRGPLIDRIQREPFQDKGLAVPAEETDDAVMEFVSCGQPLAEHEVRIVDLAGRELPERQQGRLQFKGPSATSGYFRNAMETEKLFVGDWLDSGDLAYLNQGDVYLTSRVKDIIIRAGRNILPYAVEAAVGAIAGIRKGCVAVIGSRDDETATERLVVLAETRETEPYKREKLHQQVLAVATEHLDSPPDRVLLLPPHIVLKTSSGKIRRNAMRQLYEQGRIGHQHRVWLQFTSIAFGSVYPLLKNGARRLKAILYAGYAWTLLVSLVLPLWCSVVILPRQTWRWALVRTAARLMVLLSGNTLKVNGLENLVSGEKRVIAVNHASYLDSFLLTAALPIQPIYVAKIELRQHLFSRVFLQRLGVIFVERYNAQDGIIGVRQLARAAQKMNNLLFFPEGTFTRIHGLRPFNIGAFKIAVDAGIPILPISLRGTRSLLHPDSWFPRRGLATVTIGQPIPPAGRDWQAVVALRDATRQAILLHCGEPDLAVQRPIQYRSSG
ncbi:MAG: AMP-binding protein [Desulfosarcinaceae bacterium]|nr:AMP-binding protein [Desulfosarcinaceae bacterium]